MRGAFARAQASYTILTAMFSVRCLAQSRRTADARMSSRARTSPALDLRAPVALKTEHQELHAQARDCVVRAVYVHVRARARRLCSR